MKYYNGQKLNGEKQGVMANNNKPSMPNGHGGRDKNDEAEGIYDDYDDDEENMHHHNGDEDGGDLEEDASHLRQPGNEEGEDEEIDYGDDEDMMGGHNNNNGGAYNEFGEDGDMMGGMDDQIDEDEDEDEDFFNERNGQMMGGLNGVQSSSSSSFTANGRYSCKLCTFVGKSQAKLNVHMTTHDNLKRFMCPICKRRANFKWDIQKHLRKIHNNFTDEVCALII